MRVKAQPVTALALPESDELRTQAWRWQSDGASDWSHLSVMSHAQWKTIGYPERHVKQAWRST